MLFRLQLLPSYCEAKIRYDCTDDVEVFGEGVDEAKCIVCSGFTNCSPLFGTNYGTPVLEMIQKTREQMSTFQLITS